MEIFMDEQRTFEVLMEILQAISDNNDAEIIYPILQEKQQYFNLTLAKILQKWSKETLSELLVNQLEKAEAQAKLILNFSDLLREFPIEDSRDNFLNIAIIGYQSALIVFEGDRFDRARTFYNLGIIYVKLAENAVDAVRNLELAIPFFDQAIDICTRLNLEENLSHTLPSLGFIYFTLAEKGVDEVRNLELAIPLYLQAKQIYTKLNLKENLSRTLNNLGVIYFKLAEKGVDAVRNLELAIKYHKKATDICTKLKLEKELSHTLNNLGYIYLELAKKEVDAVRNLELAIKYYKEAKQIHTKLNLEKELSHTLNNLGYIYLELAEKGVDAVRNLELAIKYYKEAKQIHTKLNLEEKLSDTLHNLGTTYFKLAEKGVDAVRNLELAIPFYLQAKQIYTKLNLEENLSNILSILGVIYGNLAEKGVDAVRNLELAIPFYLQAKQIYTKLNLEKKLYDILYNLGFVYIKLAENEVDAVRNLELAIKYYKEATDICTKLKLEKELSHTLNNLGTTYFKLAEKGVDAVRNLELAIKYYKEAADICTKLKLDKLFFNIRVDLGNVYSILAEITVEEEENRQKAIDYYREALKFFKPNLFPDECLRAGRNLGRLVFKLGKEQWLEIALEGYEPAMDAIEQIRTWATTDKKRQKIIEDAIGIYHNAVHCYVTLGKRSTAITVTERSRARYLVDLIASKQLYANDEISPQESNYIAKQREIDQLRQTQKDDNHDVQEKLSQLLQEKEELWEKLRSLDPILAGQKQVTPLELADLQALVDSEETALLNFYSTNDSTYIFILRKNSVTLHTCFKQGNAELQNWISDQWLELYNKPLNKKMPFLLTVLNWSQNSNKPEDFRLLVFLVMICRKWYWRNQIPDKLQELSQRLEIQTLIDEHLQGIKELILIPHIFLHLMPFAALPINPEESNSEFFGEKFRLRYSFSGQTLQFCQQRQQKKLLSPEVPSITIDKKTGKILRVFRPNQLSHGIALAASNNMRLASWVGEQLTTMFKIPDDQCLEGITTQEYRQLLKKVNIVTSYHHGSSNLAKPLESALELSNGNLTLGELMSPNLRMLELIEMFLGLCEGNFGQVTITDDIITIASGFLTVGATSVISTLWPVDQLATAIFCIYYYECRKDPAVDRPTAIQQAQKKLREVSLEQLVKEFDQYLYEVQARKDKAINRKDKSAIIRYLQQEEAIFAEIESLKECCKKFYEEYYKECYEKSYKELFAEFQPFNAPYYWAGFTCQGLR